MALFQRPASTPEEVERSRPLAVPPAEVAEMDEDVWYERAYRGDDAPQLTVRAVLMGTVLGFFLAFTNVYVGLKTGWHLGVAITACILSFAIWNTLKGVGVVKTPMSILENNCMQSTASAAGYSTGSTMVSAIPALLMLSATPARPGGEHLPVWVLLAWTALMAVLGVCLAIPMKRNLINRERLKFPSGVAAASTLQGLYASGTEALKKAKALLVSAVVGALFPLLIDINSRTFVRDAKTHEPVSLSGDALKAALADKTVEAGREGLIPGHLDVFDWVSLPAVGADRKTGEAFSPSNWTMTWDLNPVMIAAGALVGVRVTTTMLVGALFLAYVAGPYGYGAEWTNPAGDVVFATSAPHKAWKEVGVWLGAPILVASGLLSMALQWRTIVRAFTGLRGSGAAASRPDVEVPGSWFAFGAGVAGLGATALAWYAFSIPPWWGALAVLLTFALALVAARATGESDITPTGPMGKLMQLTYGVLIPQSAVANLMTAAITAGAAAATADLLNDLKSGYLLGAHPRRQFIAQAMGIATGTVATVTGFYLLVPDATVLNGTEGSPPAFPAPAAQAWLAVARVFQMGIGNMHPVHQQAIVAGLVVGSLLVLLDHFAPKAVRPYLPSATGLGMGFVIPFQYPLSMFVGAWIAWTWTRAHKPSAEDYVVPVSSGIIAGVSILGVLAALLNNFVIPPFP